MQETNDNKQTLEALLEATRAQARAEQERITLEKQRLAEEIKVREIEESRTQLLQEITFKLTGLSNIITTILEPNSERTVQQNDVILEILKIIASMYGGSNLSGRDDSGNLKDIIDKMLATMNNSKGGSPVNIHTGTQFNAKDDLNISSSGDQHIKG